MGTNCEECMSAGLGNTEEWLSAAYKEMDEARKDRPGRGDEARYEDLCEQAAPFGEGLMETGTGQADEKERCMREDLRAIAPQWNRWSVDNQGEPKEFTDAGDPDGDVEEYVCNRCGIYFAPDGHSRSAFDLAWQEALEHLPKSARLELAAMSCCLPSVPRPSPGADIDGRP